MERKGSRENVVCSTPLLHHSLFRTGPVHQREDVRFFGGIIKRTKFADLIKTPDTVERIEILGVAGGKLARFEIATAQILIAECFGTLPATTLETATTTSGRRKETG